MLKIAFWYAMGVAVFYGLLMIGCELIVSPYESLLHRPHFAPEVLQAGSVYAVLMTGLYAAVRLYNRHPLNTLPYGRWLAQTPWQLGDPLPMGPIHLVWEDAFPVLVGMLLASIFPWFHLAKVALVGFVVVYTGLLLAAAGPTVDWWAIYATLAGWITIFLCFIHAVWLGTLLFAIVALSQVELARVLASFPWQTERVRHERALKKMSEDNDWRMSPLAPPERLPIRHRILAPALVAWLLFCFLHILPEMDRWNKDNQGAPAILWFFSFVAGCVRIGRYVGAGYLPSVSIVGRVTQGPLLIPGYDAVWLAPLAMWGVGFSTAVLLPAWGVPPDLTFAVSAGSVVACGLNLPPSIRSWQLTGHHRVPTNGPMQQQRQRARSGRPTGLLVADQQT